MQRGRIRTDTDKHNPPRTDIDCYLLTDQALQKTGAVINVPDCCQKRRKYEDCKANHMDCCVFRGVVGF